jgi:hypothetical protein
MERFVLLAICVDLALLRRQILSCGMETHLQAPVTPSQKHLERNQKVPGTRGRRGHTVTKLPHWNVLVSLVLVSLF